jgi:hypothetical protein
MTWYAKRFPDGRVALSPHGGIQDFKDVFEAFAKTCPGAALFCHFDEDDGSATIFLTPAAAEFAAMIQASASEPPIPNGRVMRLVG